MSILTISIIVLSHNCFCQVEAGSSEKIIRIFSVQTNPVPPFAKIETEISKGIISYRNVLPPRTNFQDQLLLEIYDSWNQDTVEIKMLSSDYDSIVGFILTSGILEIDTNYCNKSYYETKINSDGDTIVEVMARNMGGGSLSYVIETNKGRIRFQIYGLYNYKIPDIVTELHNIFSRFRAKYKS